MPTPPSQNTKLAGGGSTGGAYCGICGTPDCVCKDYKEWGTGTVHAGSASADKGPPFKAGGEGANSEGGSAPPFEKKE